MPSQINSIYLEIDQNYPVAGVDNDTQGFRDNFDIIKTGLGFAGQEITALQDTTAKVNEENNFFGNVINNADLYVVTEKSFPGLRWDVENGDASISFSNGNHQRLIIGADNITIAVTWTPAESDSPLDEDRYARMIVQVTSETDAEYNVSWIAANGADTYFSSNWPANFKATQNPQFVEVSTYNGGNRMFVRYLGEYSENGSLIEYYNYQSRTEEVSSGGITLEKMSTYFETVANEDSVLPAGAPGQIKTLIMRTDGGNMNVSVANAGWTSGNGVIVFTDVGQACTLQFIVDKWYCIGNNGATFA
jgi:hypothetical protein